MEMVMPATNQMTRTATVVTSEEMTNEEGKVHAFHDVSYTIPYILPI